MSELSDDVSVRIGIPVTDELAAALLTHVVHTFAGLTSTDQFVKIAEHRGCDLDSFRAGWDEALAAIVTLAEGHEQAAATG